ncbi:hypothetical protein HPP92_007142 [Vanilla planifolia]|uniref:Uncharacterized protein n=1 Tax=Vanilla planifolia TaxID=51239 RepID=A0A835RFN8_VANPL|nr:hypothetical protein HPP92_007142 [Vanilla planifolia]
MGWASRWLRGLLGGKKSAEGGTTTENKPLKEKKRWGFGKSFRERDKAQQRREWLAKAAAGEASSEPRKGSYRETRRTYFGGSPARSGSLADEDEQSKRAIAVAAATAAVAEAAVAAAQAAAAVVRLTSSGRSLGFRAVGSMKREDWAALKIQAAFRGYLARRALKALKGLVKLQALVRGNIVRKQAAETLRCMQALVRVQARARACRAIRSETSRSSKSSHSIPGPPTPEKYESAIRSSASKPNRSRSLKRTSSKKTRMDAANKDRNHSSNWNWLDQWMEGGYCDTQQVSRVMDDDKHTKILEVDTGKPPQFNSRQRSNPLPSSCPQTKSDESSRTAAIIPDSPSKDSTTAQLSIPSQSSLLIGMSPLAP